MSRGKNINKRYFAQCILNLTQFIEHLLVGVRGVPCGGVFAEVGETGIPSPSRKDSCLGFCACTTPHQSQNHAIYVYILFLHVHRVILNTLCIYSTQLYQITFNNYN